MDQPTLSQLSEASVERERLKSLINSMADGVVATDEKGLILIYNGAALNILDMNSTISNKPIESVLKLIDKNGQSVDVSQLITSTHTAFTTRDLSIPYDDNSIVKVYLSIAPVHLGYGKTGARGYVILLRDITREKSLEEERDEFVSVTSHELRTPITIAEGNVSNALLMVERGSDINLVKDSLKQAYDQILFLSGLINDLATLSRAERGVLTVKVEEINAHNLITDLAETYSAQAKAKGLELLTELSPSLEVLRSSQLYVREILQNFITNAIKYTEKGHITIGAQPKEGGIEFWVEDTGIGISKNDQAKIFAKFYRSEDFRTRQNNGTGLGLYVTMKLVKLLQAQIHLTSELNKGSRFSVFIPNLELANPLVHTRVDSSAKPV
ncbi:MAG: sensor histidine kinase [Candidatus Saccharimonadales bacterium]